MFENGRLYCTTKKTYSEMPFVCRLTFKIVSKVKQYAASNLKTVF